MNRFNSLRDVQHFDAQNFLKRKKKACKAYNYYNTWNIAKQFKK